MQHLQEWKETARWIKYQEAVEVEGNRWSKPHISTPKLQGWLQLRHFLSTGLVILDLDYSHNTLPKICDAIGERLVAGNYATYDVAHKLKRLWMLKHRHQFEGARKVEGNLSAVIKELLVQKLENKVHVYLYLSTYMR